MSDYNQRPPSLPRKMLSSICPEHIYEEIAGDLEYRFNKDVRRHGIAKARRKFWMNSLKFFRPSILFRKSPYRKSYPPVMFKNYFIIAFRNMMAQKMNSVINMSSLIIGITSAVVMLTVIRYELSFDQFHANAPDIYRVYREASTSNGTTNERGLAGPSIEAFRTELSATGGITAVQYYGPVQVDIELIGEAKKFKEGSGAAFVDQEFFKVFDFARADFKWIGGDQATAFSEPFSIVLTKSIAKKYFGDVNPVGQSIRLETQLDAKVTGVVSDFPENSDFPFTMLISYATLYEIEGERMKDDWQSFNNNNNIFLVAGKNSSVEETESQLNKIHKSKAPKEFADNQNIRLQPLASVHKDAQMSNFTHHTVDESALWIMGLTGFLLLLVGCINYINIATAQSTLRLKEIGVRKVLGSQRTNLVMQFLSETFIVVSVSCLLSVILAEIVLNNITMLTNMYSVKHLFMDKFLLASVAFLILSITIVAGFYPAFVVSGFGITQSLRGLLGNQVSNGYMRKTLVVVQFAVTQAFLIGAFIVINQLQYSRSMDLGFNKEMIITAPIGGNAPKDLHTFRSVLLQNPVVTSVSLSSSYPSGYSRNYWVVGVRPKELSNTEDVSTEYQSIDTSYLHLYGIRLIAGRNFSAGDSVQYAIINETLAKAVGYAEADDAVGKVLSQNGAEYTVVGVVRDFHNSSTKNKISNMLFVLKSNFFMAGSVKIKSNPESIHETLASLEKSWATAYPSIVFDYKFFDENIDKLYSEEKKLSTLLQIFSVVFLIVACLGLYGLLSFVVNRRMKEVAVRKVFGAGMRHIIALISRDYVILIIISFAIAAPLSWFAMNQWLESYQYHMPITWWIIAAPGLLALTIAMLTLGGKIIKTASKNPAETLKYE